MSRPIRLQRVERELREIVSLFLHHQISEPLPAFASVTDVEVSKDIRHATVFFRIAGADAAIAESKEILNENRADIQRVVAKSLPLKYCPVIKFEFGVAQPMDEVDELLWKLKSPKGDY